MSRKETALKFFDLNRDYFDERVKNGIELYRKGNAKLVVKDRDGKSIENAKIGVKLVNHEFRHGANIFMLDELETKEKNDIYKDSFAKVCNLATIPFYWRDLEVEEGKPRYTADSPKVYRRPATDICVDYCLKKGIEPKCHCLNYENFLPTWLKDASIDRHKKALEKRFRELAERYADVIPSWEVTNETLQQHKAWQTAFYKSDDFVEWSFRMADRYFKTNKLIINDYDIWDGAFRGNRSGYYMQIDRVMRNGISHLDSIGMQYHSFFSKESEERMAETRYNPEHLYAVLDKYEQLGKKLQITEMTLPAYSGDAEDEEIQAKLLEDVYSLFFSHKAMEAVIYWNLVDGYAAFAPMGDMASGENKFYGGLMRFDMSEKPAYKMLKYLFSEKWHTEENVSIANGNGAFRGFYGDYEFTVNGKKAGKFTLSSEKNNIIEITV